MIFNGDGTTTTRTSAQYNGDKFPGQNSRWTVFDSDANEFVRYSYREIANRCATLYHTSAIARACVTKPFIYAIGDGLIFRSAIDADFLGMDREEAKSWSRRFSYLLHLEKLEANYYEKTGLLFREAGITGDAILYFLREDESEIPFDPIVAGGHNIDCVTRRDGYNLGVEVDGFNRRRGFYTTSGRPVQFRDTAGNQNALMFLLKERPGQARGFSRYYSEIGRSKSFDRLWDATVERMVQEAVQLGFFNLTTSDPRAQAESMARAAAGNREKEGLEQVAGETALTPGAMYTLRAREGMSFNDLKAPSNNFDSANEWTVNLFGMATGYAPEFLMSKYSTSYTAHRGALNDTYKKILQERGSFVRNVESAVNVEYLKHFARTGQISVPPGFWDDYKIRRALVAGSYLGPVPGHVSPLREVRADVAAENAGYIGKGSIAAQWGTDFWPMLDEMHAQRDAWDRLPPDQQADQLAGDDEARDNSGKIDRNGAADARRSRRRFFVFGRKE